MQAFAHLLDTLVYTQSRNRKIAVLARYFRETPDPDRGYALAALTDGLPPALIGRLPLRRMLAELTSSFIDPVLYKLSRDYVGDTAETVALLWPDTSAQRTNAKPSLHDVIETMRIGTTPQRTDALGRLLNRLDTSERWALLKLLGGAPRVGVSARLAKTALAEAFGRDVSEIEELWHALEAPYGDLFAWLAGRGPKPDLGSKPVFRPVMLAHPIEDEDWPKLSAEDFAAEWKWDGIRVQIAAVGGDVKIFSRQGDDVSSAFPEIRSAFLNLNCVTDGELLVMRAGEIAPFNDLQQRLNRKVVTAKMLRDYPAHVRLYDLLFEDGEDLRALSFTERRARLETWQADHRPPLTDVSDLVRFESFDMLRDIWSSTRDDGIEGLMLKRRDSAYQAGRVKGQWFKWKRAALTLDCVLMYAQRGSGKRSSFYSDYTFGVWRESDAGAAELVPVGKAYSGFTDEELKMLDKWIRTHTTETFGPVRAVSPGLVLEVAFDAVQPSTRHKSGVAMRFPRVHRIRWDKPAAEADTLEATKALIGRG
ncbi:MAG: cisplatin damage response ATP-dependent DNA ligase [Hyphomicrobium sp.]|nr:cisplatin damage response ATP-dependent DNA ligase [Hyphomicrobium sp.]